MVSLTEVLDKARTVKDVLSSALLAAAPLGLPLFDEGKYEAVWAVFFIVGSGLVTLFGGGNAKPEAR